MFFRCFILSNKMQKLFLENLGIEYEIKIYFALSCLGSEPGLESVEWPLGKKKLVRKLYMALEFFFPNWVTRISSQEIDSSLIQMDRAKGGFFSESTIRFSNLQRKIFQKSILNYAVSVSFTSALIQKNCCHLTIFLAISFPRTGTRKSINVFEV